MSGDERRLPSGLGGNPVWRSGRGVHRVTGPWSPTVHALLRHLEAAGFDGSPRVVGTDGAGREILTYIDGEVLAAGPTWRPGDPTPWQAWARTEECLVATGRLLRLLHDAAATFVPPEPPRWRRHQDRSLAAGEIVCHGDIGPHNTVYRAGLPVAFIDWDTIRPGYPLVELGDAAWRYVPLGDPAYFERTEFGATPDLARRLALFVRAYGVGDAATVRFALQQAKERSLDGNRSFDLSPAESARELRRVATELEWLDGALPELVAELD